MQEHAKRTWLSFIFLLFWRNIPSLIFDKVWNTLLLFKYIWRSCSQIFCIIAHYIVVFKNYILITTINFRENIYYRKDIATTFIFYIWFSERNWFSSVRIRPSGPVDVQWTSIERPYQACGRPKGTFNGRLVDVPNETQLVRPNRTKMDVHFRPSRDAMHGTWMSSGSPPDVH